MSLQEDYNKSDVSTHITQYRMHNDPKVDNNEVLWDHFHKSETSAALDERNIGNRMSNVVN